MILRFFSSTVRGDLNCAKIVGLKLLFCSRRYAAGSASTGELPAKPSYSLSTSFNYFAVFFFRSLPWYQQGRSIVPVSHSRLYLAYSNP